MKPHIFGNNKSKIYTLNVVFPKKNGDLRIHVRYAVRAHFLFKFPT